MIWKELPEGWLDEETGLIWDKTAKTGITHYQAEEYAKEQGKRLPTKEEFETAEKHGIRKVLPEIKKQWLWSSTVYPGDSDYAYEFYGGNGGVDVDYRDSSYDGDAARCVSLPGAVSSVEIKLDSLTEALSEVELAFDKFKNKLQALKKDLK